MATHHAAPTSGKWSLVSVEDKEESCNGNHLETWIIQRNDTHQQRRFFVHVPPSICQQLNTDTVSIPQTYPILLAFHGYGGAPMHEIKKWKSICNELKLVLVAPRGTMDEKLDRQISWNAIDCCGSAVSKQVDDVDFVNGVIDTLGATVKFADTSYVVATGFSNGGFFSSRLGLLPKQERPVWLKAIVPTGGYQYDTSLYNEHVDPLPMFAHHGGSDTVVRPGGCCLDDPSKGDGESNCPAKIGSLRDTCLPVQEAFTLWATHINDCDDTIETIVNGTTCWEGKHCRATTKLCVWPDAQHMWGSNMPGVEMVGEFLDNLLLKNESVQEKQVVAYSASSLRRNGLSPLLVVGTVLVVALAAWVRKGRMRYRSDSSSTAMEQEAMVELVDSETSKSARTRTAVTRFV